VLAAVTDPAPIAGFAIVAAGVCAMGWNALAFTLTVSLVPLERVGTSQGALIALIFAAWGISPMATGYLVQTYSWSVAWLVLATLAVLGAAIASTRGFARRPSKIQQYR
jgi:MFS family permease